MADNLNDSEQTTEQTHEYLEGHDANGVTETQEETKHNHDEPGQTNTGKEESDTNGANCEICENADSDRPVVELFVKVRPKAYIPIEHSGELCPDFKPPAATLCCRRTS